MSDFKLTPIGENEDAESSFKLTPVTAKSAGVIETIKQAGLGLGGKYGEGSGNSVSGVGRFIQAPAASALELLTGLGAAISDEDHKPGRQALARDVSQFAQESRDENVASGNAFSVAGKGMENVGKDTQRYWKQKTEEAAPIVTQQERNFSDAKGFVDSTKAAISNPLGVLGGVAQSMPDMVVGMGTASAAGKLAKKMATQEAMVAAEAAGKSAAVEAAAVPGATEASVAEAVQTARQTTFDTVRRDAAVRAATPAGSASEAAQSGMSTQAQVHEFVLQQPADQLYANNDYFRQMIDGGMQEAEAKQRLANSLSAEASGLAAIATRAGSAVTGGGVATAKTIVGGERMTGKELLKRTGQDTAEEAVQGIGEEYSQYRAQKQADPKQEYDFGGTVAKNAISGLVMGAGGHGTGYVTERLEQRGNPDGQTPMPGKEIAPVAETTKTKTADPKPASADDFVRIGELDSIAEERTLTAAEQQEYQSLLTKFNEADHGQLPTTTNAEVAAPGNAGAGNGLPGSGNVLGAVPNGNADNSNLSAGVAEAGMRPAESAGNARAPSLTYPAQQTSTRVLDQKPVDLAMPKLSPEHVEKVTAIDSRIDEIKAEIPTRTKAVQGSLQREADKLAKEKALIVDQAHAAEGADPELMAQYNAAKQAGNNDEMRRLAHEINGQKKKEPAKAEAPKGEQVLSLGTMPNNAEPITVKNGIVYVGSYPAQDYDSGDDVTVPNGATPQQIRNALAKAGAIARGQKVFGLPAEEKAPKQPKAARDKIDASKDSLFVAIAKLGGMDTQELLTNGFDRNDITQETSGRVSKKGKNAGKLGKKSRKPIAMGFALPLHKNGGMSFDGALEALKQHGYFAEDATKNDAIDAFRAELGGDKHMTPDALMQQAEQDQAERDAMMAAEQDRIDAENAAEEAAKEESGYDDLSEEAQDIADDFGDIDNPANAKTGEDAMRAFGFTEDEINEQVRQGGESRTEGVAGKGSDAAGSRAETDRAGSGQDGQSQGEVPEGAKPVAGNEEGGKGRRAEVGEFEQGRVGMKLAAGQIVLTASGRETTPFPKFQSSTGKMNKSHLAAVDAWLLKNAEQEAVSRGDTFNSGQFERDHYDAVNRKTVPQASKDAAEEYLFGQQPAVVPSILKSLVPDQNGGFTLAGQTPAEVKAQEAKRKADEEAAAKAEREPAGPTVKVDQVELFNTQGGLFGSNRDGAANTDQKRGESGASLTKEQRKEVLTTLVDVYKKNEAPIEFKGFDTNGNERSGYAYSPEFFVKSDITGAMVRYFVTLPDGRIAHPTELFADYTQADIDTALRSVIADKNKSAEGAKFRNEAIDSIANESLQAVRRFRGEQFRKIGKQVPDRLVEYYSKKEGKWFSVEDEEVAAKYANEFAERGYRRVETYQNDAPQGQAPNWKPKTYFGSESSSSVAHDNTQGGLFNSNREAPKAESASPAQDKEGADLTWPEVLDEARMNGAESGDSSYVPAKKYLEKAYQRTLTDEQVAEYAAEYQKGAREQEEAKAVVTSPEKSNAASWVIRDRATGAVIMETFDRKKVDALNMEKYEAIPIQKHLAGINKEIKAAEAKPKEKAAPTQAPSASDTAKEDAEAKQQRENPNIRTDFATHRETMDRLREGTATLAEYKAAFERLLLSQEEIKNEIGVLTKDAIFKKFPHLAWRYKNEKKADIVKAASRSMLDDFVLEDSIQWNMSQKYENVIRGYVEKATVESLREFAEKVKRSKEERQQAKEDAKQSVADPKTLEDFGLYMRAKLNGGMTEQEARLSLTPEQRAKFDDLFAGEIRSARTSRTEAAKTEVRVAAQTTTGQVIETKHTKTGEPLFVVKAADRVERDVYNQWNTAAKKLGGWYSSFRGNGAVPGFQFKERENADAFLQYLGGDTTAAKEVVQERRDEFADDRSQSAVERLTEMADRLEERADESLGRERKANTDRRARFAASAEAAANAEKALAKTMRNIASAIESGKAKFLDRVRQKAQVEMLRSTLRTAQYEEQREKYPSYADQEKHRGEKPTTETADYARWPNYTAHRSDLARLGRELLQIDGAKQLGKRLLGVADDLTEEYRKFAKENLHKVSVFSKKREGNENTEAAVFRTEDDADAAIARSGFKGKAMSISFKRGQHLVIMGPEMAREAGHWQGDDDKRITLRPEFADELLAKARKGISIPNSFESAAVDRARWKGMGIESAAEMRAALREYVGLREAPAETDKIKQMERAMIGRRQDGLDFFPTPASVAQEMIDTANIKEGMSVLEPSAGMGHIAEQIRAAGVDPDVVEFSGERRELLEAKGFHVVGNDFIDINPREFFTFGDTFRAKDGTEGVMRGLGGMGSNRVRLVVDGDERTAHYVDRDELTGIKKNGTDSGYDRIIMNPPFSDRRDAEHVQHAYSLLKPGGRIVAIMGEGVFYGQDKKAQAFREWLDEVGGTSEKLPEGTFLDPSLPVNTSVNARLVVIDRPLSSAPSTQGGDAKFSRAGQNQQTVSPEFKRWFGNWAFDPKAKVSVVDGGRIGIDAGDTAAIRQWLISSIDFKEPVRNLNSGVMIEFTTRGLKDSLKRRGDAQRNAYSVLRNLIESAHYVDHEQSNRSHLAGQDIYYGALRLDGKMYSVRIKTDVRTDRTTAYKDHRVDEVVTDLEITPAVSKGGNEVALGYPVDSGPTQSGVEISLGQLVGENKPAASKAVDADSKPLVVYHGAPDVRGIFKEGFKAKMRGEVWFASDSYATANTYADAHRAFDYQSAEDQVVPLYLSIKNPMIIDAGGKHWRQTEKHVEEAKAGGHDGIIIKNSLDDYNNTAKTKTSTVYAWFSPTQAKSAVQGQLKSRVDGALIDGATGNNGDFDASNPDIRMARGNRGGIALQDLDAVAKSLSREFPGISIVTVEDERQLPKSLRDEIRANSASGDVSGAFHKGNIYLIQSGISDVMDAQVRGVHEVVHAGLRAMGVSDETFLNIGVSNPKLHSEARKIKAKYGYSFVTSIEEAMADMGPAARKLAGWKRVIANVRDKLRKLGFVRQWTDNDVEFLVLRALRMMKQKDSAVVSNKAMYSSLSANHNDEALAFAAEFVNELAIEDDAFRYAISKSKTLEGSLADALPGVEYLGEDTRPDEREESKADHRFVFAMPNEKIFYVYTKGKEVWIDVSRLLRGDKGAAVYHGVANYAYNTGKTFIGDPLGLSEDAVIRRTGAMLSSAVRFGTTSHIGASREQMNGDPAKGIEPLAWRGDDVAKTKALIHTYLKTLQNLYPEIIGSYYDFASGEFRDGTHRPLRWLRRDSGGAGSGQEVGSLDAARSDFIPSEKRVGETSVRRGILLQSLMASESSQRPELLGYVLRRSAQLTAKAGGPFNAVFSRTDQGNGNGNDRETAGGISGDNRDAIPAETKVEAARRVVQDKFLRFKVVQDWLKAQGVNVSDLSNVYRAETLMHGRVSTRIEDFREKQLQPLIQRIQKAGFTLPEIAEYLEAKHTPEANQKQREIHKDPEATAAGVTDADALAVVKKWQENPKFAEFEKMADEVRSISDQTRDMLVKAGILSQEMAEAWQKAYQHYVPLKGGAVDPSAKIGAGPGLSVKAKQKRRLGHGQRDEFIIENIIAAHEKAIRQVEKNRVGRTLALFLNEANNDEIGTISKPVKRQVLKETAAYEVLYHGTVVETFHNQQDARTFIANEAGRANRSPSDFVVTKSVDPIVVLMASPMLAENEAVYYLHGKEIRMQLNDEKLARAYKNLGVEDLGKLLSIGRDINSWLSKAYTGYNPEFLLVNIVRDFTAGIANMTGDLGAGFALKVVKNYPSAMKALWKSKDGNYTQLIKDYRDDGGSTGAAYLSDLERVGNDLQRAYDDARGVKATWQAGRKLGSSRVAIDNSIAWVMTYVEHLNRVGENAMRVALYKTLRDAGKSRSEAAEAAKNVTVNFNRKGEIASQAGAAYLFFNPNVQGTAKLLETMLNSPHKRQANALIAGMAGLAFILANIGRGDDEDEWRNIPSHVKDRNLVFTIGGKQITLPVPYGYGFFHMLGNAMSDLTHGVSTSKVAMNLVSGFFEHFSPVGNPFAGDEANSKNLVQLLPTLARIPGEIAVNRTGMGGPIMPEKPEWDKHKPDSQTLFRSTKGGFLAGTAEAMNSATGGTKYESGAIDVSPETLKYLIRTFAGGTGTFFGDAIGLGIRGAQGAAPEFREIPVVRKFVREESIQDVRRRYYEATDEAKKATNELAAARRNHDADGAQNIIAEKRELIAMGRVADKMRKSVSAQRDAQDRIMQDDDLSLPEKRSRVKALENEEAQLYNRYLKLFQEKEVERSERKKAVNQ